MKSSNNQTKAKKVNIRVILVIIFLLIYGGITYFNIRGEYLYNLELGECYVEKFMQNMQYNSIIFILSLVILFLLFFIITIFIKKGLHKFFIEEKQVMPKLPNKSLALVISAILTIIIVPEISSKIILSINATSFEIKDQIFNMDIGYYVFQRPIIELMLKYMVIIGIVSMVYISVYYIVALNMFFNGVEIESLKKNTVVRLFIFILLSITLACSIYIYISSADVLFSNFFTLNNDMELVGAGSTDILFKIWGLRILSVIILISVILIIFFIKRGEKGNAFKSILIVPLYLIVLFILMVGYQYLVVNQNKLDMEYSYIQHNINNTQNAYNIKVEEKDLPYSGTVNYDEVQKNKYNLDSIPVMDESTTLTTLKEYQNKQGYYLFNNTKLLEYNDELVYITPREIINSSSISKNNKTYEYTHGFGTVITSATKINENGGITYLQSDFESNKETDFINITQPRIYFGLSTNDEIVINLDNKKEFDYPLTTAESTNNIYEGKAGLKLGFLDRLILSIKEKNIGILFASGLNEDSKILLNRNIIERAKKALPDIVYDENPYLVINNEGRLIWILDGYTISDKYPYSNTTTITVDGFKQEINYIRNSVKVLIDAYDGTTSYYIIDRNDPIIMAYRNIYPSIFKDLDESIPDDINKHITYPQFLYDIQSEKLNIYHNIQPEVLYRNDNIWEIATYQFSQTTSKATKIASNYITVSVENSKGDIENKLGLVIPYTLEGKQNLNSYLIGVYDETSRENKLFLNKFISNTGILGPKQLERQINEDSEISKEIENISLTGTRIIKNLYIVPIENTILYVEPIYQVLVNETPVPVLKKVIVSSGNKLAIGNSLEESLTNLLSQYAVDIEVESNEDIETVIESIIRANNNLKSSSESKDWSLMGQDIEKLQEVISLLERLKLEENKKEADTLNEISNELLENIIE